VQTQHGFRIKNIDSAAFDDASSLPWSSDTAFRDKFKCAENNCVVVSSAGDLNGDGKVGPWPYSKLSLIGSEICPAGGVCALLPPRPAENLFCADPALQGVTFAGACQLTDVHVRCRTTPSCHHHLQIATLGRSTSGGGAQQSRLMWWITPCILCLLQQKASSSPGVPGQRVRGWAGLLLRSGISMETVTSPTLKYCGPLLDHPFLHMHRLPAYKPT
jgi:hypothetical protein